MKNYSDLLGTDLHLDLVLVLEPVGIPEVEICVNQQLIHQGPTIESIVISTQIPLLSQLVISVKLKNKVYKSDQETAIILNKISIDEFDIVPKYTQLAHYINDHNVDSPTSYIGFNGEWKLEIPQPFYQWRHKITGQGWLFHPKMS